MTEQQKRDSSSVKPIGTWATGEEPGGRSTAERDRGTGTEPIPDATLPVPPVDQPAEQEPRTSPETERELDRLRRD